MLPENLDMDALRTLQVVADAGSFVRAAPLLQRTRSALSLQMSRLAAQAGRPLFRKQGRRLIFTEAGELVLAAARRILAVNDALLAELSGREAPARVRLGLPQDVAEGQLPRILAQLSRAHPQLELDVRVDRGEPLLAALRAGQLDLAGLFSSGEVEGFQRIAEVQMSWIASPRLDPRAPGPLPLVVFEAPCVFRSAALAALDRAGHPWRIAFTSPSLSGLWAAAAAGLGVTPRSSLGLPRHLRALSPGRAGLPKLPRVGLWLAGSRSPAIDALRASLMEALAT
jgi:DNA-binding transcriptional LysR family regulator